MRKAPIRKWTKSRGYKMKIHNASASGWYIGHKCPGCRRTIKYGEAIFSHDGASRWHMRFAAHRECAEKVFDVAPDDATLEKKRMSRAERIQAEFDELRERLAKEHGAA